MTDRRLIDAHMRASADRQDRTGAYVARLGRAYGWDSAEFVDGAVDAVLAAQADQVAATWAYLEEAGELFDGRVLGVDPPIDHLIGAATHAGTPLETVYRRPARLHADLVALDVPDAAQRVAAEAHLLASTDVAVAGRNTEQVYGAVDRRIIGWRRVPNAGACAFCRLIATQDYHVDELAPAHRSCKCGTAPRYAPADNPLDADAYQRVTGTRPTVTPSTPPPPTVPPASARFADDDAAIVAAAERYGVTPDEVVAARGRVAEVRQMVRDEAAKAQLEAFEQLDDWNARTIARPPRSRKDRGGEWDWLDSLHARERARLSRIYYDDNGVTPDVIADQMRNAKASPIGADVTDTEALELWLDATRRYEAAGALRRGKLPSTNAYSGQIDVDTLLPDLVDDGYRPTVILGGDDLEAAAHIAGVERGAVVDEALDYLGAAANPRHGPAPFEMSYQAWEEEVRTLTYGLREYPQEMPRTAKARLAELVPEFLDDGQDYEDLYALIVDTAHRAAQEVPDHARIPWR